MSGNGRTGGGRDGRREMRAASVAGGAVATAEAVAEAAAHGLENRAESPGRPETADREGAPKRSGSAGAGRGAGSAAALAAHHAARAAATAALREAARPRYEAGESLASIAQSARRTPATVSRWAKEYGWSVPERRAMSLSAGLGPAARRRLVARLFAAFERQVGQVEARASAAGKPPGEAEVKVVGALARTLEVLIELDRAACAEAAAVEAGGGIDADALREEIARRLDRLRAG